MSIENEKALKTPIVKRLVIHLLFWAIGWANLIDGLVTILTLGFLQGTYKGLSLKMSMVYASYRHNALNT